MITPLSLSASYRDFWADYNSHAEINLRELVRAGCYTPRYYATPNDEDRELAAGGNLQYNLILPAGSFIFGFFHRIALGFVVQITDVALQNQWFSNPVADSYLVNGNAGLLNTPNVLPNPYPVVGPGIFIVEFWNPDDTEVVPIELTLGVAEIVTPPCN